MIAQDVMTTKIVSVEPTTTLQQIAKTLMENGISGVPVIDGEGFPIGMVTEGDLIALNAQGERETGRDWWLAQLAEGEPLNAEFLAHLDHATLTARAVMATPVVTVSAVSELPEVARLLTEYKIKRLPVMRDGHMVGIVSRADLVRQMAQDPGHAPAVDQSKGMFAEAVANLEDRFTTHPASAGPVLPAEEPDRPPPKAEAFRTMVDEFGQRKDREHDAERVVATKQHKALVKEMTDHHISDEAWQDILTKAQEAAKAGQKELLLLRFPCELCSDGGRAVNAPLPDWPETLRGEAAEIYLHWERDLKPNGFHLTAQVVDFPGGIPGDIGLTLVWGGQESGTA